ncbi:MAG: methyltransferase, TIGR04325 family [bacterium]|nr:methyltransferase, TIGR04325 family [bacterium]
MRKHIWEGIYRSFEECPVCGEGFEGDTWASRSLTRIKKLLEAAKEPGEIPSSTIVSYSTSLLPFLSALVLKESEDRKVIILDFGGGPGFSYIPVVSSSVEPQTIEYHVVESKKICGIGRQVFKNDTPIHFYSSLPEQLDGLDIVYFGSSLQYVKDWKGLIRTLAEYRPRFFLFEDLSAGNIPTYVTVQNYYESKIPSRFYNIKEIVEQMNLVHFSLVFKSAFIDPSLKKEYPSLQENFPKKFQLSHSCNLLFVRR